MFRCATATLLGLTLCYSSSVWSQNPDYVLEIEDTSAVAEHPFDVPVLLSNTGGDIQGFSAGMCSDDTVLNPTGVIPGAALQGMNGGSGPEFFEVTILPGGIGCGTVFSFTGAVVIHPFAGQAEAEYSSQTKGLPGSSVPQSGNGVTGMGPFPLM